MPEHTSSRVKHRLLGNGFLDEEHWLHGQGTKYEVIAGVMNPKERTDRFASRRLQNLYGWTPTDRDVAALVELLEHRGVQRLH